MASVGSINFGGLVSGLDTNQLIEDLMTAESKPLTRLETRKTELTKQQDTYTTIKSNLDDLKTKVSALKSTVSFGAFSASSSDEEALSISASPSANSGTYSVKILSLAQAETLSSNSYSNSTDKLGLNGEILVNGESFKVKSTDSIQDIRNGINTLNAGATASILNISKGDNRLIINSQTAGENGFFIANVGDTDILGALGITDGTKQVREVTDNKVLSSLFSSSTSTIGSLAGISSSASGNVGIRGESLKINLSKDTLTSIRDKINGLGIDGVSASIESVTEDDITSYRLAITGTEAFTDDGNVLETLGILEGGTEGVKAEFQTETLYTKKSQGNGNGNGATKIADSTSKLVDLVGKSSSGDSITISGTTSSGSSVSRTIQISSDKTVGDILSGIEEAFSNTVQASIQNGKIVVQSDESGKTALKFSIKANNESGSTLDFGVAAETQKGRDRVVVQGSDAKILVNNIEITRDTNEINDAISGLNLTLKKADTATEINLTVKRDNDEVQTKIEAFVKSYNDFVDFIDTNSKYDKETKTAGPLLGDQTSISVLNRIRSALRTTISGEDFGYTNLAEIGVESTSDGKLSLDTGKLKEAMNNDMDSVVSLFTATRLSSDNDISFAYHSEKTKSGTYNVTITRAAEKAEAVSTLVGKTDGDGTLSVTDNYGNTMNVAYSSDMTPDDIANAINTEAQKTYAQILKSTTALNQTNGDYVDQNTLIKNIDGVEISANDTITISGTNRTGKTYQKILNVGKDDTINVQDILDAMESIAGNEVNATIDSEGRIQTEDIQSGTSSIGFTISTTVKGLDFGTLATAQKGRNKVTADASVSDDNRLTITHTAYGADYTLTIEGGKNLGIADGTIKGVDVAGTINGAVGTGKGQNLTASNSDENSRGIVIRAEISADELAVEGPDQGTVTLVSGIADILYNEMTALTSPINGYVQAKIDNYERSLDSLNNQIESTNKRLEQRRAMYVRKFTELETAMSRLQTIQQRLTASLSSLPQTSL
ncbi:flagellar filament capping protein FliD [bacterium]|nr:flagellar filament capping protein FliD [bacterium]